MRYKLIALDLDGTLNNSQHVVTARTLRALEAAQGRGATVALVSGRPAPGLAREAAILDLHRRGGFLVSYNGGRIVDASTGGTVGEYVVPVGLARRFLKHLEGFPVAPIVDDGKTIHTTDPANPFVGGESLHNNLAIALVGNLATELDFAPAKVLVAAQPEVLAPCLDGITAPFINELSFVMSSPHFFEAMMKGTSKGSAVETLCRLHGIAREEVMAFGDAANDLSMIEFAGLGVAMGNACTELKDIADETTSTNDEDGIANVIERFL